MATKKSAAAKSKTKGQDRGGKRAKKVSTTKAKTASHGGGGNDLGNGRKKARGSDGGEVGKARSKSALLKTRRTNLFAGGESSSGGAPKTKASKPKTAKYGGSHTGG